MKKLLNLVLVLALAGGAWWLLRPRVLWLDYFTATITDRREEALPTVSEHQVTREISYYFLQLRTADGRELEVEVPQDQYFRARPGMKVRKGPFTTRVELVE